MIRYLYEEKLLSQQQVGQILGCSKTAILYKMRQHGIKTRSKAEAQLIRHGHLKRNFNGDERQRAYLIGFCVGDGHVKRLHEGGLTIRVDCSSTRPEQIELFENLFSPFGHIWKGAPDQRGKVVIASYLNLSFDFLLDLEDEIPPFALADEDNFSAFLAGYIDAEGHIGINSRKQAELRLQSCDRNILHQTHVSLVKLGITGPKPWINRPEGYTDGQGVTSRRDCWCLQITAKSSLVRLFGKIGPYLRHSKRVHDMNMALRNIEKRS
ncbi:MAG: hypothetical protein KKA73_26000 [Chloroflexi bacterium]|nr:hypothetical protein [Chloroflexota bacterium]MBU1751152.1 hypothetical protein [Chloroflexota bacterium]